MSIYRIIINIFINIIFLPYSLHTNSIQRFAEHGIAHYLQERLAIPAAQIVHGDNVGGLPSQQQKITSKIEEQSGVVTSIGLSHVVRVMILFCCGIAVGVIVLFYEFLRGKFEGLRNNRKLRPQASFTIEQQYRRSRSSVRRRRILIQRGFD